MRHIFYMCMVLILLFSVNQRTNAQESESESESRAGKITMAVKFGKAISFSDLQFYEVNRTASSYYNYSFPKLDYISNYSLSTYNSVTNMVGAEFKYFLTNDLAIRLSAVGSIESTPLRDFVEGTVDLTGEYKPGTYIPSYSMMEGYNKNQFYIDLGVDHYFNSMAKINPFVGVQFNGSIATIEITDGYNGIYTNDNINSISREPRKGEVFAWGASIVGGADYYIADGFFIGLEIKALNFMYAGKQIYHESGLEPQKADNYNWLFFSQPSLKLGFSF